MVTPWSWYVLFTKNFEIILLKFNAWFLNAFLWSVFVKFFLRTVFRPLLFQIQALKKWYQMIDSSKNNKNNFCWALHFPGTVSNVFLVSEWAVSRRFFFNFFFIEISKMSEIVYAAGEGPSAPVMSNQGAVLPVPQPVKMVRAKQWDEVVEDNYRFQ